MIWLYVDTKDAARVAELSTGVFWLVLPTLLFFILLPWLIKQGAGFWAAMGASAAIMVIFYLGYAAIGKKLGLPL